VGDWPKENAPGLDYSPFHGKSGCWGHHWLNPFSKLKLMATEQNGQTVVVDDGLSL
jgi:hypothetical protein